MLSRESRLAALGIAALVIGGGVAAWCGTSPRAVAAEDRDTKLKALLKERHAILEQAAEAVRASFQNGRASYRQVAEANRDALRAELDLCETDKARVAVLEKLVAEARNSEAIAQADHKAARASFADTLKATADRLEAEIALERARSR